MPTGVLPQDVRSHIPDHVSRMKNRGKAEVPIIVGTTPPLASLVRLPTHLRQVSNLGEVVVVGVVPQVPILPGLELIAHGVEITRIDSRESLGSADGLARLELLFVSRQPET